MKQVLNYLKADFYRLIHSKGFFVSLVFLLLYSLIIALAPPSVTILNMHNDSDNYFYTLTQDAITKEQAKDILERNAEKNPSEIRNIIDRVFNLAYMPDEFSGVSGKKAKFVEIAANVGYTQEDYNDVWGKTTEKSSDDDNVYFGFGDLDAEQKTFVKTFVSNLTDEDAYYLYCEIVDKQTATINARNRDSDTAYFDFPSSMTFTLLYTPTYASVALVKVLFSIQILMYFILAAASMLIMAENRSHTFKNTLSKNFSREKVYVAKFIGVFLLSVFFYLVFALVSFLLALIVNGSPGGIPATAWEAFFAGSGVFLLYALALSAFATGLSFIFKQGAAFNTIFILFFLIQTLGLLLLPMFSFIQENLPTLAEWDFNKLITQTAGAVELFPFEWKRLLVMPICYIVVFFTMGFLSFQKSEIK